MDYYITALATARYDDDRRRARDLTLGRRLLPPAERPRRPSRGRLIVAQALLSLGTRLAAPRVGPGGAGPQVSAR